jgi:hypothetical protein
VGVGVGGVLDEPEEVTGGEVVFCGVDVGSTSLTAHALWKKRKTKTQTSNPLICLGINLPVDSEFGRNFKG